MRARVAVFLGSLALGLPGLAGAEELPGGRIEVFRSPAAARCPDGPTLVRELTSRMTAEGGRARARGELLIRVRIDQEASSFVAVIEVEGRKLGVRTLKTAGPGCDALSDALLVALLVLLDEDPERAAARPSAPPEPVALPAEPHSPDESRERAAGPGLEAWFGAGAAVTQGMPEGLSYAVFGEVTVRLPRWEVSAGAFWAPPEREVSLRPGTVAVRAWGGRLRGCLGLAGTPDIRLSGCGLFVLAALRGEGKGYTPNDTHVRPWWFTGLGPDFRWFFAPGWALGFSGSVLFSPHRESFIVEGLGTAYDTDRFLGWLGADLAVQIW